MLNTNRRLECQDQPELFWPVGSPGNPAYDQQANEAKQICQRCPLREDCLTLALQHGGEGGIQGGLTEAERRALRRSLAKAG
ncbi:WhiB family transcriptional regulator [Saccharomonospora azurea]|uniref:WhiB family transcriptional regulator n=1 Tax=Saccharomonospora azurea TaxID=40988 RepID=UPI0033306274